MAGNLEKLIQSATNSPAMAIEEPLLKSIKSLVRSSDDHVKSAVDLLMNRLGKNHSQVRYLTLLIIDEIFTRSKLFRTHLVDVLENFLLLSLGYRADQPLPPPADRAALLKKKALEIVERWNDMFGPHYKQLQLGYEYLKNTLHLNFPGIREAATRVEEERNARERRTQDLLRCRLVQLSENFTGLRKDVESTLDQMEECFSILNDGKLEEEDDDEFFSPNGEDDVEVYGIRTLRYAREHEDDELVPEESHDNAAVFDMLRDLIKLVVTRHLPATQEWLSVLMRVDPEDRRRRDALMKEVIDLRSRLQSLKGRCEEFGVEMVHKVDNGEDDIEWEEDGGFTHKAAEQQQEEIGSSLETVKPATSSETVKTATSTSTTGDLKTKLLQEAPVLEWGSFLAGWGSEVGVPANARGLSLDNHWGRVDPDVVIPSEKLAEMQVRASYYQPQKSDIRPCLAPLRHGRLCQRRDLRRCPLHGPVVPRDDQGRPLEQVPEKKNDKGKAVEQYTLEDVAAQAVKNVRDRDEADRKTKKLVRQSQARVDREHNEAVLRSAAVTLDSSAAQDFEVSKKRKGGLTAMLRKQPTPKERIAKKLLSGRAAAATVATLARAEDAAYRESFPNQW